MSMFECNTQKIIEAGREIYKNKKEEQKGKWQRKMNMNLITFFNIFYRTAVYLSVKQEEKRPKKKRKVEISKNK